MEPREGFKATPVYFDFLDVYGVQVLYVQPYNPHAEEEEKRPFVLIIQDQWMLKNCMRFSHQSAWAVDSTFKTNVFGLPLYAAVVPNQLGVGIPVWLMMCTNDIGTSHESIALELTFRKVLSRMHGVRPTAIVIDKNPQELHSILKVIDEDPHCWDEGEGGNRHQIACHVLLCWFHVKKAWVENLLPQVSSLWARIPHLSPLPRLICVSFMVARMAQVPANMQDHVYSSLSNLMHTPTEEQFDERYIDLMRHYSQHANVQRYITNGWCARTCEWQRRWPKFGRLFPHGYVDTTNLVERLWQYIKYTLLDAKINRPILSLLHAFVGDSTTGTHMGGTLLEFFKQKQEIGGHSTLSPHLP